jgi:CheY-like chemotaxis protein
MASSDINSNDDDNRNKISDETTEKLQKSIESYSLLILFCLIAAVLLLSFNLRLMAGCLVIAGVSFGLIILRKSAKLNNNLNHSIKYYSSLYEKKDAVIIDFSHKIREPLSSLVSVIDILRSKGLDQEQNDLLDSFYESTTNMVSAVNELTMQSGANLSFENRKAIRFNLLSTLLNTIELYSLKEHASLHFLVKNNGFSDFECVGDPIILKQILLDIINTYEGSVLGSTAKVVINVAREIRESGENIYNLTLQADNDSLPISENEVSKGRFPLLISRVNGTYRLELKENLSLLCISIPFITPVVKTEQKTSAPKIAELIKQEKTQKELKDIKILLVEDNPVNQKITILTLKSLVREIDTAQNGKEALDKFGTSNYDLILMDIQMPLMNGLIAAEKIRALEATTNRHIPIIAITANAMLGDKEKCISAGIDDYLSKPFQPATLVDIIRRNIKPA